MRGNEAGDGAVNADWITLRLLLEAIELGSMARAALRCGIAHSAAAKRLRVLEAECGLPLLERGARGVRATEAGEAVAQREVRLAARPSPGLPPPARLLRDHLQASMRGRRRLPRQTALLRRRLCGHCLAMRNASAHERAVVREVGPRDGLQMSRSVMSTDAKLRWIAAMAAAGLAEMEVASFVPPSATPGMADAAEGLLETELASAQGAPGGVPAQASAGIPALPVSLGGARPPLRRQPPRAGEHSLEIAREAALPEAEIAAMLAAGTLLSPTLPVAAE